MAIDYTKELMFILVELLKKHGVIVYSLCIAKLNKLSYANRTISHMQTARLAIPKSIDLGAVH